VPLSPDEIENLWLRLNVEGRIRPRDALKLRALELTPFACASVFETNAQGYVTRVGRPGKLQPLDPKQTLTEFCAKLGVDLRGGT